MATDLQVFRDTVNHRPPERLLFYASFTPDLQRRVIEHIGTEDIAGHYGFLNPVGLSLQPPQGHQPVDYSPYWQGRDLPDGTVFDAHGVALAPSGFYHFTEKISPLTDARSLADIEKYPLEDLSTWNEDHLAGQVAEAHAAGRVAVGWVGHIYETAWQIRGYQEFLIDMIQRPEWAQCLLDRLAANNRAKVEAFARAGVDWLRCGDDVANQQAMMFSPATWRRMLLPLWRDIWQMAKRLCPTVKIWYHSDGNILAIMEELAAAGVDIFNPLQPECLDIDAAYAKVGQQCSFDGLIGTQSTMPWGSAQDVSDRVAACVERYGQDGGLILSPTHVLEPEVPLENIDAFAEACRSV
mgnify:CR=1 FL=1